MMYKLNISIIILLWWMIAVDSHSAEQDEYTEGGKVYYRPASVQTSDIVDFDKLSAERQKIIKIALKTLDDHPWLKYQFGSADPEKGGFDCSGAMFYLLSKAGLKPPRTSSGQYQWVEQSGLLTKVTGKPQKYDDPIFAQLKPGDLIFWGGTYQPTDSRKINVTHVMLYLGKARLDGRHIMVGASKGRSYRGKRQDGYGIYDFKLPSGTSKSSIQGYGTAPRNPESEK